MRTQRKYSSEAVEVARDLWPKWILFAHIYNQIIAIILCDYYYTTRTYVRERK